MIKKKRCSHCNMDQPSGWNKEWCKYCTYPSVYVVTPKQQKKEPHRY